jgi:hypothetical protein
VAGKCVEMIRKGSKRKQSSWHEVEEGFGGGSSLSEIIVSAPDATGSKFTLAELMSVAETLA